MSTSTQHKFWLTFQVYSDGLDSQAAQKLAINRTTFPQFPLLPAELRLKIWEYLLTPRIIAAACFEAASDDYASVTQDHHPLSTVLADRPSYPLIPALLQINHETRTLGLSHYSLAWSWKVPHVLSSLDLSPQSQGEKPEWSDPHIYFSFAHDTLFLLGELEPSDPFGFNSPMSYFLRREETLRTRHVAVSFGALHYGETGSQQIFGALFHVVDRFARPAGNRILVCVAERALMGSDAIVEDSFRRRYLMATEEAAVVEEDSQELAEPRQNVVQKIWRDWYRGSITTSKLADVQFQLIRECELERYATLDVVLLR